MPLSPDDDTLPDSVKKMPTGMKKLWVRTYNSVFARVNDESKARSAANKMCRTSKMSAETSDLEEDVSDEALESFIDVEVAERPSRAYLARLSTALKGLKGKKVDDEAINHIIKSSAGYAGAQKKSQMSQRASEITDYRVLYEMAETPATINVLPVPGTYKHPGYGTIKITQARNEAFVDNFNNKIYQDKLPIDAEHETKLSGAFGWITSLNQLEDGSVDASVEWTDRGTTAIEGDRFKYFSPEWYDEWTDPATGKKHKDVLIGGAVTTRPFFKDKALKPLVASEMVLDIGWEEEESEIFSDLPPNMSFDDLRRKVEDALRLRFPAVGPSDMSYIYISDLFEDYVIYCGRDTKYHRLSYDLDNDTEDVALGETPVMVERSTIWRLATEEKEIQHNPSKGVSVSYKETAEGVKTMTEEAKTPAAATFAESPEHKEMSEKITTLEAELATAKKASEEAQKSSEALKAAEGRILSLEQSARRARFAEMVKEPRWYGEVDKLVSRLEKMADAFGEDSEEFKDYIADQKSLASQLATSELFKEVGTQHNGGGGSDFQVALKKYQEENPGKSEAEAITAIVERNPKLYSEYRSRMNEAAAKGLEVNVAI